MIARCRSLEMLARDVSGYFFDATRGPQMRGGDSTHARVEIYLYGENLWIGLDATNNQVVDDRYLKIATGRDYRDAPPIEGTCWGGGIALLEVLVAVDKRRDS
jgi:transglutaminase-like putative cysteine protease